jgi:hypothetical protein
MAELIGIGGRLRHGKDAVADFLEAEYGYVVQGMNEDMTGALRVLNPVIGVDPRGAVVTFAGLMDSVGYTQAKGHAEFRRLLQCFGTDVMRNLVGENVWAELAAKRVQRYLDEGRDVILTGIRYDNELHMVESLGGRTWWVDASERVGAPEVLHSSENSLSAANFEVVIDNNGTLDELYATVRSEVAEQPKVV